MGKTNYSIALQEDSKSFITEATLQLLNTKSFNKLTVMEVVKRAGVSRMAFYRNFESIEDVLKQYYTPKFEIFFDEVKKKTHQEDIEMLLAFFTLMKKDLVKAINQDYDRIFFDILTRQTEEFLRPKNELESFEMTYVITGTFAVWKSWLSQENTTTLEEMSILLTRLTKNLPGTM